MSRSVAIPFFPSPPAQYDQAYFANLVRAFSVYAQQMNNPGPIQASSLVLPTLPTAPTGLAPGTVYNDSGTLKIAP